MSKKIYSRTITQDVGGQFIDRIQVETVNGVLCVTAYSKIHTNGVTEPCEPIPVNQIVLSLIEGRGQHSYTLEP